MPGTVNSEIIELFFQVSRSMKERMIYETDIANLSLLQLYTLMVINRSEKDIHMKDIAEYFSIEMPTATTLLTKLDKLDLVKRTIDQADRRNVTITLTSKGKALLHKAMEMHTRRIEKTLAYLSSIQKNNLLSILKTLSEHI